MRSSSLVSKLMDRPIAEKVNQHMSTGMYYPTQYIRSVKPTGLLCMMTGHIVLNSYTDKNNNLQFL